MGKLVHFEWLFHVEGVKKVGIDLLMKCWLDPWLSKSVLLFTIGQYLTFSEPIEKFLKFSLYFAIGLHSSYSKCSQAFVNRIGKNEIGFAPVIHYWKSGHATGFVSIVFAD